MTDLPTTPRSVIPRYYLFLAAIIFCVFSPVLRADFLNWDDTIHVSENKAVLNFDSRAIFTQTVNDTYIPLTTLSFALEKSVWGLKPFVFHFDNILLHVIVAWLLLGFFLKLGVSSRAAFCGVLFFALHPMRVESVGWVTERKDMLYALFYVLALRQWLAYLDLKKPGDYALTLLWGLLSLLSKPMAVSLPLVMIFMEWWRQNRPVRWLAYGPFFVMTLAVGALTYSHQVRVFEGGAGLNIFVWVWTLGFYIWKSFWPFWLCPIYGLPPPKIAGFVYGASVFFVGLVLWGVKRFAARDRWLLWAAGFLFLSIFFLLRFDSFDRNVVADRFLYLPATGICLWLGVKADQALTLYRRKALAVVIIIFGILAVGTFRYASVWKDSGTFWSAVITAYSSPKENPHKSLAKYDQPDLTGSSVLVLALYNRGIYYKEQATEKLKQNFVSEADRYYHQAVADFDRAISLEPQFAVLYNSRALARHYLQDEKGAREDFTRAIEISPVFQEAFINRCSFYGSMGELGLAMADCQQAIKLGAETAALYHNLGMIYTQDGLLDLASKNFEKARALDQ